MSCRFESFHSSEDLLNKLKRAGWKEKLALFRSLEKELSYQTLSISANVLAPCWPELLKETNLNALERSVCCLRTYVRHYSICSLRIKKEIVNELILLAKMKRPGLNTNILEIVTILFQKERAERKQTQRIPFGVISDRLDNIRQPTFLPGTPAT